MKPSKKARGRVRETPMLDILSEGTGIPKAEIVSFIRAGMRAIRRIPVTKLQLPRRKGGA